MVKVINRDSYLNQLIAGQQNGLIKIVTGIRRCGKSFLLFELFHRYLTDHGTDESHIIEIALDDISNEQLRNPHLLLRYIKERIIDGELYYVLLDEIQLADRFEEVLNSLLRIKNVDVYVTGSNSRFLSTDIVTEFRGRGDEIHLYPLSFAEFFSACEGTKQDAWKEYYTYGGLPIILSMDTEQKKATYLRNLYESVYMADIIDRHRIANRSEFDELSHIMASSIGSSCNPTKLSNTFLSVKHVTISHKTIGNYLSYMQDAFLIERAMRYDIKGKKYINTLSKYYFSDIGIRNALLDFRQQEETHIMENVIYNELRMRGFLVDVGMVPIRTTDKTGRTIRKQFEVDFVVNRASQRYYIQSALAIPDKEKEAQESQSLLHVNDAFKKIIIVKDDIKPWRNDKGILIMGLIDFLLNSNSLEL
ncbi:MAG: ATP-binding protein [Bacteroidaceae bacterium]|nr:ATP-binding protein [Bacteroidaceae bacterium]